LPDIVIESVPQLKLHFTRLVAVRLQAAVALLQPLESRAGWNHPPFALDPFPRQRLLLQPRVQPKLLVLFSLSLYLRNLFHSPQP
jgi:hypothetical protein